MLYISLTSDLGPDDVAVIREVYDDDKSEEIFLMELERALQVGCRTIIIEPPALGAEIQRWIERGSRVKKMSVVSGLASLCTGVSSFLDRPWIYVSLGVCSGFLHALYCISWRSDPCSNYKIQARRHLSRNSLNKISSSPALGQVVLMKKKHRGDFVVTIISCSAAAYALWRIYS